MAVAVLRPHTNPKDVPGKEGPCQRQERWAAFSISSSTKPGNAFCRTRVSEVRAEGRGGHTRQRSEQRVGVGTHDRGQSRGSGWAHTSEKKSLDLTPLVPHGNTFIEYLGNSADKGDGKLRQTSPGHLCTCLCELGARSGQSWCGAHPE